MSRHKSRPLDPSRTRRPGVRTKIYVRHDMVGSGKIDLLREIGTAGSISGAARAMGLGYRRAWFLLDTIQRCFAEPLVETRRGGTGPGGARLTELGQELIRRYDAHSAVVEAASAPFLDWLEAHQSEEAPETATGRVGAGEGAGEDGNAGEDPVEDPGDDVPEDEPEDEPEDAQAAARA